MRIDCLRKKTRRLAHQFVLAASVAGTCGATVYAAEPAASAAPARASSPASTHGWLWNALRAALPATEGNPPIPAVENLRDPTEPQGELRQLLANQPEGKEGASTPQPVLPAIIVVGKVVGPLEPPTVMLSFDKRTIPVRPGGEYLLASNGTSAITLQVLAVTPAGVEVQIEPLGKRLVLP